MPLERPGRLPPPARASAPRAEPRTRARRARRTGVDSPVCIAQIISHRWTDSDRSMSKYCRMHVQREPVQKCHEMRHRRLAHVAQEVQLQSAQTVRALRERC